MCASRNGQKPRPRRVKKLDDFPTSVFANSTPKWTPKDVHLGAFFLKKNMKTYWMRKVVSRTLTAAKMEQKVTPGLHMS